MVRFGYAVTVGSFFVCLMFACGDKMNPKGTPRNSGPAGAGGATENGDIDGSVSEAGIGCGAGGTGGSTTAAVSYSKTIAPMMAASCTVPGCHNSSDKTLGFTFDTYAGLEAYVDKANTAIQNGDMPIPPGADLTAADKKNFQDWVTAGSPNN